MKKLIRFEVKAAMKGNNAANCEPRRNQNIRHLQDVNC